MMDVIVQDWLDDKMSTRDVLNSVLMMQPADAIALLKACKRVDYCKLVRDTVDEGLVDEVVSRFGVYVFRWVSEEQSQFVRCAKEKGTYPPPDGRWPADCLSKEEIERC